MTVFSLTLTTSFIFSLVNPGKTDITDEILVNSERNM